MAFHDDVDDENDANDKTSSEHDFELPFPRRATSSSAAANPEDDDEGSAPIDLSAASSDGAFNLDAALGVPITPDPATRTDLPPPPSASDFAPIDLNDQFQRSEMSDGLDQGMPPWAMAPAPDPNQAVQQLDAPDGLSVEQRSEVSELKDADDAVAPASANGSDNVAPSVEDFAPKSAAAASDDPYQIPVDYTTPDFFASRISRSQISDDSEVEESAEQLDETADSPEPEAAGDVPFDSLFAPEKPEAAPAAPTPSDDTSWAAVSPPDDREGATVAEDSLPTNNVWKLGPLAPNESTAHASSAELPLAAEEVIEGAPMWNLDGVDAPEAASDAGPADAPDAHVDHSSPGEFPADAFSAAAAEFAPKEDGERTSENDAHSIETEVEREAPAEVSEAATSAGAAESSDEPEVPAPPVRRSMADDELLTWADNPENQSTGTLSVIEVLEAQLRLREEEAREYREWETTLRSKPAPVDEELSEQAHPEFSETAARDDDTAPTATQQAAPESAPAAPPTPAAPLPAWEVAPPSDTWAPAEDFDDEIPFAAHADPTGSITLPVLENEAAVNETTGDVQVAQESAASLAGDPEREPESVPENTSVPEPEPEQIVPHFDAESGLLSLNGLPPVSASPSPTVDDYSSAPSDTQFEPTPEFPADEDGDYDEIPFSPPPLVEPITAPSTPRSNLDEHVSFGDFGFTPPISGEPEAGAGAESPSDSAASAMASDSGSESPFAFDLNSPLSSVEPTGTHPQSNDTGAREADDHTQEAVTADADTADAADAAPAIDSDVVPSAFSFSSPETPRYVPTEPLSFDDLLKNDDATDSDEMVDENEINPLNAFLAEPAADLPQHGDPLSAMRTGSIPISEALLEAESDDAVDASDRLTYSADLSAPHTPVDSNPIPFAAASALGAAAAAPPLATDATDAAAVPPPVPLSTARVSQQPLGMDDVAPTAQRVFSLEESGLEPTPVDRRIGHAARLFWLWFAANSSIVSIGLGAAVFAVGMSLRQSIVAILAGVALSFIPLGLTTLAGKRSGQPTMVISRSTFGVLGNIVPSVVALVARLFWGAVLLWVLASSVAIVLIGSDLNVGLGDRQLLLISLALSFLVALVIAFAGYPLFARIQLILSILSGVLVVGLIAFTAQYVDVSQALTTPDGSWLLTITGAVLVFSFLGLVWAYSGADIARYQRPSSSGPASALSAAFGATVPAFVLIAYGALLAASDPAIARGFLASPLDTLLLLLPGWYPIPLLLAAALSLLSGITLSLYSGGFALQAIGVRLPRQWSIVIVGVLLGTLAVLFAFGVNGGINELFRDVATTLAVPTAAWIGIFAAETMIRTRRLDGDALTTRGGIYSDVRWVNLSSFIVISAIGFALTSATISWLSWQGYGFVALGVDLSSALAATDLGVLVALALGILTPIVSGIPAIRRQEAGRSERAVRRA